jgi:hypothetical protein
MASEPSNKPVTISSPSSKVSTAEHAVYAAQRARLLFGNYRRGDANDPDTYVAAMAAVLTLFDRALIAEVTDPRTGIQTTERFQTFPPQPGELKRYCDTIVAHRDRIRRLAELPSPLPVSHRLANQSQAGSLANVFVPQDHSRYAGLCEWTNTADPRLFRVGISSDQRPGLWISREVFDSRLEQQVPLASA